MTWALIDGDIIAFRAAAGVAQTFDLGDGHKGISSNPEGARESALQSVQSWARLAKCKDVMVTFTGDRNFRKTILPSYKANRKGKGKPPDYRTVVQAVQDRFETLIVDGLEADDLMGILATTDRFIGNAIVLTQDKDLRTVPGVHMNPLKDTKPVRVTEDQGDYFWLIQTLMGDTTDGYTGIPGCGPAKAAKILGPPKHMPVDRLWPLVLNAYRAARLTEEDALTQARVARILRRSDYDKTTKEVLLWHPTTPTRLSLASLSGTAKPDTAV